jgi:phosphate:Na+ symporter
MIRRYTGTRLKGLVTGLISTAVLQSSSAVSLMVLAFVGAGLMTLVNAVAVIMGAMVGTTLTAWIVAVFGFKFKIDAFALPLIGIGGLGLIVLSKAGRYVNISKLCAAFGFLFLGLDFMKTSIEDLTAVVDLSSLPDLGLWIYVLAGVLLTAVMQSSSATIAVILTTLFSGIIDFSQGAAMVIGANIGTTVTILIGAVASIPAKKQTAVSSLVFNLGTALVILPALPVMFWIINDIFGLTENPVLGIAAFHTLFNLIGVILFFPAIPLLVRYLERMFPEKRTVLTRYILNTSPEVPEAALAALRMEVLNQLSLSMGYVTRRYGIEPRRKNMTSGQVLRGIPRANTIHYHDLESLHAEIFAFYARIQAHEIDKQEAVQLEPLIRSSRSIMNAVRNLHDLFSEIDDIGTEDNPFMISSHKDFKDRLKRLRDLTSMVTGAPNDESIKEVLDQFFTEVENADKRFISSCSQAVAGSKVRANDVTQMLMVNRLFTQSNRMLVLSMQALTR